MQPNIHFLTHEFSPFTGGIGVYIEETARACAAAGNPPLVWAPDYGQANPDSFPFSVRRIRMRGKQDWICRWLMGHAFCSSFRDRKAGGTVILAEPGPIRWWMYGKLTRPPVPDRLIVILHGSELARLARIPHRRFLLGRLLENADCVGVVSGRVKDLLFAYYPGLKNKVTLVPGAVRQAWSKEPAADPQQRANDLIQVGRIHPRKGQLEFVNAVAKLPPDLRKSHKVRLIGPVSSQSYADKARQAAVQGGVNLELTGVLEEPDLRDAYRSAALTVMPSQPYWSSMEGLGIALLEAQHFGCPVVATETGGIPEAMIPGETGLLVPPGNSRALALCLQQLLENPHHAIEMGNAGARFVRERFSWRMNLEALKLV